MAVMGMGCANWLTSAILIKDHKKFRDDGTLPGRPLCLASSSPNGILADLVSNLADRFSDAAEAETECDSTEEMCRGIEIANRKVHDMFGDNTIQNTTNNTVVLGSMDAIALYPSLRLDQALAICLEMALETDLTVKGADWREMMKYIAVMMPEKEIEKAGMNKVVPRI